MPGRQGAGNAREPGKNAIGERRNSSAALPKRRRSLKRRLPRSPGSSRENCAKSASPARSKKCRSRLRKPSGCVCRASLSSRRHRRAPSPIQPGALACALCRVEQGEHADQGDDDDPERDFDDAGREQRARAGAPGASRGART